jgi:2-keto-4-pentenoate hydratase/2-oxohepta-3-ene-1,7-dioic acid hydratase in catechol pathway
VTATAYVRLDTAAGPRWAREEGDLLHLLDGAPYAGGKATGQTTRSAEAVLLAPARPSKIVGVGRNYRDHAAELGNPVPAAPLLFLKPETAVIGPGEAIHIPSWAGRVDHEAELGVVIGRAAHDLPSPELALDHVFGAVCVNDVTARELQKQDVQFTRGKGFDTFCPVGPRLVAGLDLTDVAVRGRVNGALRQEGRTAQLLFPIPYLVWFVARVMTLRPGDIISTGTPAGVGPLLPGDVVEVEVEGVGVLRNPVV